MQLTNFTTDDDAVSPVIGVILMVAITVILAAVIATFVLGLGDQVSSTGPQTTFAFDYDETSGQLEITHDGGGAVEEQAIWIRGGGSEQQWEDSSSKIKAGNSMTYSGVDPTDTIRVVWESSEDDSSRTLSKWEGADS